jgi:hypothetical protein
MHSEDVRSSLLETKYKIENKPIDHADMHVISCLKMIKATGIDCEKFKQLGCQNIRKTESLLPNMISPDHLVVRSIDGSYTYDYVRWEDYTSVLHSKYKEERDKPYYSKKVESGGIRIYLLNDFVKTITIEGLFHSIIKPYLVKTCDDINFETYDYRDFIFPISPSLKTELYDKVFNKIISTDQAAEVNIKGNDSSDIANPTL